MDGDGGDGGGSGHGGSGDRVRGRMNVKDYPFLLRLVTAWKSKHLDLDLQSFYYRKSAGLYQTISIDV